MKITKQVSEGEAYPVYALFDDIALPYKIVLTKTELNYINRVQKEYEKMQQFIVNKMTANNT